jgi:hypothetical protein
MRKKGNYSIGAARKGTTVIQSYEPNKGGFNSAGTKRKGDTKYMDRPDAPKHSMNPDYAGGTCPDESGMTPTR